MLSIWTMDLSFILIALSVGNFNVILHTCRFRRDNAQNPLHTLPRNFSVVGEDADLLRTQ